MYHILFARGLEKDLKEIPKADQKRLMKKIESLALDPFPPGCKALQGNLSGYHRNCAQDVIESSTMWTKKM